jgi:hypothetical protein
MIYTCYEMIRDCRANRPEGWSYFISAYVPVVRKLIAHYYPEQAGSTGFLERMLQAFHQPGSSIFLSLEPAPERWFVAELRQQMLAGNPAPTPAIEIDLETVAAALEPFTLVEKQATWLETMAYTHVETGAMMRMSPQTVEKIREKAAELIRGRVSSWSRTLLADNGVALGRAATAGATAECLPDKPFLDVLEGRATWQGRDELDRHVNRCWHCIDHFSRLVEVVELLRGIQPLSEAEAEPFRELLGIQIEKRPAWKKLFGKT